VGLNDLVTGPLGGRFYRLDKAVEPSTSVLERARDLVFHSPTPRVRFVRGFCSGKAPNDGDLDGDDSDLSYDDGGTGMIALWVREEERKVSKRAVLEEAARRSLSERRLQLADLSRHDRKDLEASVRAEMLQTTVPGIRVVPVVVCEDWAWVGCKGYDEAYRAVIHGVFGAVSHDTLVMRGDIGFAQVSLAAMQSYLDSEDGHLDADVELIQVKLKGQSLQLKAERATRDVTLALRQLLEADTSLEVRSLQFSVDMDGENTVIDMDENGVFRINSPRSSGGLIHEALRRRFGDGRRASARVGELLSNIVYRMLQE